MSEDLHKYNDFFREKLDNHESSVPDDLFERLMSDRTLRGQLGDLESAVPENLFDKLMRDREGSDEMPSDAPLRERLLEHEEVVLKPSFEDIIAERERRRVALLWRSAMILAVLFMSYFMFIKNENLNNEEKINKIDKVSSDKPVVIIKDNSDNENKNADKLNNGLLDENNASYTEGGVSLENKNVKNRDSNKKNPSSINSNQAQNTSATSAALVNLTTNLTAVSKTANSKNTVSNSADYSTELSASQQTIIPTTIFSTDSQAAISESMNILGNSQQAAGNRAQKVTGENQQQVIDNQLSVAETANTLGNAHPETQNAKIESQNAIYIDGTSRENREGVVFDVKREVFDFEKLSIFQVKNIALPTRDLKNPCTSIGPGDGCPSFDKRNRRHGGGEKAFYVDVYGAPEYAFRRFAQNLPESAAYLNARDTVEKPWYAFSVGTRASVVFENGLAVRTGLVYAQTNEIAVFDSLGVGKKVTTETYVPHIGGGQDTIRKTEITSGIFRTTRYNRYRSIDIPLQLGFEFPMNDNWLFSLNGGVNFNISSWRKAYILNSNFKSEDISSGLGETNPVFRNSLGLSLFGSVVAYRQLTSNLQLVIEPSIRHSLQPITRTDYALKQAYTHVGLNLGLRLRL
jgi:hypothetical protein